MNIEIARAQSLLDQKQPDPDKAIKTLKPLLKRNKVSWLVYHFLGVAEMMKGNYHVAIRYLQKSIKKGSSEPVTYHSISICEYNLGEWENAIENAKIAVAKKVDFFEGWLHLGTIYRAQAKLDEALICYRKANTLDPKSAAVAFKIAGIYADQGDLGKAIELLDITIKLNPDNDEAIGMRGQLYMKLRKFEESREDYEELLRRNENMLMAHVGLADLNKAQGDYDAAIEIYENILKKNPANAAIRVNYALCLQETGRFDESEYNYLKALDSEPGQIEALSNYLMGIHYNPNRTKEEIFEAHKRWDETFSYKQQGKRPVPADKDPDRRLRVGFISGGFKRHPVGWMVTKALENLPADQFEVYCYTTNNVVDSVTKRISERADVWRSVIGYKDSITASIIRDDEIDILVELSGHAADNRLRMVTMEPAPIIVKWVGGLFNTTGIESIDYLLSDWHETPAGEEEFYTEKLVRLPDDYICYLAPDYAPDVAELPMQKNGYVTLGCFNNPSKINPVLLKQWARIMHQLPESKLFLKSKQYGTSAFRESIKEQMQELGIGGERLIFEAESMHDQLMATYNRVDIALDPWPYSGGLTTCEALYMGVPVVTYPGPTFAGRHAVTHIMNAGMEDFVVDSWDAYVKKVVSLASDPDELTQIRGKLRSQVENSPLCDGRRYGAHLSVAFRKMWQLWVKGQEEGKPEWKEHISVETLNQEEIERLVPEVVKPKKAKSQVKNRYLRREQISGKTDKNSDPILKAYTRDGIAVCLPNDNKVLSSYVMKEKNEWIDAEVEFLKDYLKPGMKVIDAGAGYGMYALPMAAQVTEKGTVYAFEPASQVREFLERGKDHNEFEHLQIIAQALSDKKENTRLSEAESPEYGSTGAEEGEEVESITLDEWWKALGEPSIDVLKVDVNGTEYKVLKGASDLLKNCQPLVVFSKGDANSFLYISTLLMNAGYSFYQYINGANILTELDGEADPYLRNIIGASPVHKKELEELRWLYGVQLKEEHPKTGVWAQWFKSLPWTEPFMAQWEAELRTEVNAPYLEALDMLCEADSIQMQEGNMIRSRRPESTNLYLKAAQILIDLFNNGQNQLPVALTLARTLNILGKRGQSVQIMKTVLENTLMNKQPMIVNLPFMLPLAIQDEAKLNSGDLKNWLKVRIAEAWVLLKDETTYFSNINEKKILKGLSGNPDMMPFLESVAVDLISLEETIPEPDIQPKEMSGLELVEQARETESGNQVPDRMFSAEFWEEHLTPQKAVGVVEFLKEFTAYDFNEKMLEKVVEETFERMQEEPTDNLAFYIQVHALLSMPYYKVQNPELIPQLEEALEKKKWTHKKSLYAYWLSAVDLSGSVPDSEVSAVIISNKFNKKSVENLKRLSEQLRGKGEIVFVNNGANDEDFDQLRPYINTWIKLKANSGAYLARNIGSLFANGEFLLFVDDDGIPDEDFVDAHLRVHRSMDILASRGVYYSNNIEEDPKHYCIADHMRPAVTILEGNAFYKAESFFNVNGWGDYILFGHGGKELTYKLQSIDPDQEKQIFIPESRLNHKYVRGFIHHVNKEKKQTRSLNLLKARYPDFIAKTNNWPEEFTEDKSPKAAEQPTVWVLDPGFQSMMGHHSTYSRELREYFRDREENVKVLINKRLGNKLIDGLETVPLFTASPYIFGKDVENDIKEANTTTYYELKEYLDEKIKPGDKIVMHTTGLNNMLGVLNWYKELPHQPAIEMRMCFQESMLNRFTKTNSFIEKAERRLLEYAARFYPTVKITCAPEPLSDVYGEVLNYKPEEVGCMIKSSLLETEKPIRNHGKEEVLYISSGREVQGVRQVMELALKLAQAKKSTYRLTVFVGFMEQHYKERFRKLAGKYVKILDKDDEHYSYEQAIANSSVVLLPYEPIHFKDKFSGILLDVLATKTPVITTAGTFSDRFVQERFASQPGVSMNAYTSEALSDAIDEFVKQPAVYKAAAEKAAEYVRERYNAQSVIKNTIA